jgi:phosphatidylinositol alpha-1,6-mannosyltransferase
LTALRNLFVTQNFPPVSGGMARRHAELVSRYGEHMAVSTIARRDASTLDSAAPFTVYRQPFGLDKAKLFTNELRWGSWLARECDGAVDVMHCGEIRPVGYAVWWAHKRTGVPYVVYVNGGDLLRERQKAANHLLKRVTARRLLSNALGIVANSAWSASLARDVMREVGVDAPPPVAEIDLGTNPDTFSPARNSGALRARLGIGDSPIMLTVARLVPHKGQDTVIRVLAALRADTPDLRYVIVGGGDDEPRLRALAASLGVGDRVYFTGQLDDAGLADAYATSNLYVGMSRLDRGINVEGFGISFVEASASAIPVVAGDSGGVRSAVRDGETGIIVPPEDVAAAADAVRRLLESPSLAHNMGEAGRAAVESHYNWNRVAAETRQFVHACIGGRRAQSGPQSAGVP